MVAVLLVGGAIAAIVAITGGDEIPTRGASMMPTLAASDDVDIDFDAYASADPEIGDVVAVSGPGSAWAQACERSHPSGSPCPVAPPGYAPLHLIKRIVAGPGDRVAFADDGGTIRNGVKAEEPFIIRCAGGCGLPVAITVPPGHVFVAGDNRPVSNDSRTWGSVPIEAVEGRVLLGG
ncbi:MAG: signal peptidase I [Solirubrobacterales bacterium]